MQTKCAVIFDLDGTLINSLDDIASAVDADGGSAARVVLMIGGGLGVAAGGGWVVGGWGVDVGWAWAEGVRGGAVAWGLREQPDLGGAVLEKIVNQPQEIALLLESS